jgi:hypothetical protein
LVVTSKKRTAITHLADLKGEMPTGLEMLGEKLKHRTTDRRSNTPSAQTKCHRISLTSSTAVGKAEGPQKRSTRDSPGGLRAFWSSVFNECARTTSNGLRGSLGVPVVGLHLILSPRSRFRSLIAAGRGRETPSPRGGVDRLDPHHLLVENMPTKFSR